MLWLCSPESEFFSTSFQSLDYWIFNFSVNWVLSKKKGNRNQCKVIEIFLNSLLWHKSLKIWTKNLVRNKVDRVFKFCIRSMLYFSRKSSMKTARQNFELYWELRNIEEPITCLQFDSSLKSTIVFNKFVSYLDKKKSFHCLTNFT